jgi:hypothetical protein
MAIINKTKNDKLDVKYGVKTFEASEGVKILDLDLNKRIVTGFYNTQMYFDSDWDVSLPGSYSKSISEKGPQSSAVAKIKHLVSHDWKLLPGAIQTLEEREIVVNGMKIRGMYFETKMSRNTLGTDTLINYQEGVYDNHSFGFRYMDIEMIDQDSSSWKEWVNQLINPEDAEKVGVMFLVKEYRVLEGSTVGLGANSLTPYLGVKSGNREAIALKINNRFDLLTKQLKSGTQSDETMQMFEMEILQLQQLTKELFDQQPSIKDTLLHEREKREKQEGRPEKDTFDLDKAIREIKFFN